MYAFSCRLDIDRNVRFIDRLTAGRHAVGVVAITAMDLHQAQNCRAYCPSLDCALVQMQKYSWPMK